MVRVFIHSYLQQQHTQNYIQIFYRYYIQLQGWQLIWNIVRQRIYLHTHLKTKNVYIVDYTKEV